MQTCSNLKSSLLAFLGEKVRVAESRNGCVVTLPMETLDKRRVSVIVEKTGDTFLVHDGGKTLSELFCHGISITATLMKHKEDLVESHGAHIRNKIIRKICKAQELETAIFAVAQCSSMAMIELVSHRPVFENESITSKVSKALDAWRSPYVKEVRRNVDVRGRDGQHKFSFVCLSEQRGSVVAIKILASDNPKSQAERYGFLGLDLDQSEEFREWKRLAIISDATKWGLKSPRLARRFSDEILEIDPKNEDRSVGHLPAILDDLVKPSAQISIH